ncbi:unnamed protein product [Prunus armeniaca]
MSSRFKQSGKTISRYFNSILDGVIRLQGRLLKVPEPIPDNCIDNRWRWFKKCLGALDGTYIRVCVPEQDKPRYRTRKGEVATNVLGLDYLFGCYYLVDDGYTNGQGYLAPYRGIRYHLSEWRNRRAPNNHEEYFNMKHAAARNMIERCFGLLKMRWACCLLLNLIRGEMVVDPLENELNGTENGETNQDGDVLGTIEPLDQWTAWRDNLAMQMYDEWNRNIH